MSLKEICMEVLRICEGLEYGDISFSYDRLASAMKMGHPAEILEETLSDIFYEVRDGITPEPVRVEKLLKDLKRFQRHFKVKELSAPIKELSAYLEKTKESHHAQT